VAYAKLARAAVQLTAPGGTVLLASCSSRVSADEFHATVEAAARQLGRPLDVFERTAHACDHPVRASGCTPYLKATFARV
jgi:23S rRNA (cytosine1962-C5)-methyltransferase